MVECRKTSAGNLGCVLVLGHSAVDVRALGPFQEGACPGKVALPHRHGTEPPESDS